MLNIAKIVLGPVLLTQGRYVRRTALRLPEATGPRDGVERAPDLPANMPPIRLLFVGDSSAAGVGVDSQEKALAQQAARHVAEASSRAVHWQLVAKSGVNTTEALALVDCAALQPADILVTALGVNDVTSQRSPQQFLADYRALVATVERKTGARGLIVNGLPPLHILPAAPQPLRWYLGQCAFRLDRVLRHWVNAQELASYVSLQWAAKPLEMARDKYHPGAGQYATWAGMVAGKAVQLLQSGLLQPRSA